MKARPIVPPKPNRPAPNRRPPPPPRRPVLELDTGYKQRAENLIKDAQKKAYSTKTGLAAKRYFKGKLGEDGVEMVVKLGTGVALGFAVGAIAAAGVASAVCSFGIGPALAIVAGLIIAKSKEEISYHLDSKKVKSSTQAVQGAGVDEDQFQIAPPDKSLVVPAVAKVLKKLVRVETRANQLRGGAKGLFSKVTGLKTAIRGARATGVQASPFAPNTPATTDSELNRRLLELRFYGQMTFNYIEKLCTEAFQNKENIADSIDLVYQETIKQVHFITGNHDNCGGICYTMSEIDVENRKQALISGGFNVRIAQWQQADTSGLNKGDLIRGERVTSVDKGNLFASLQHIQDHSEEVDEETAKELGEWLGEKIKDMAPEQAGGGMGEGIQTALEAAKGASAQGGHMTAVGLQSAAAGSFAGFGAGVLVDEIFKTAQNRWLNRKVMKQKDNAFNLTQQAGQARDQAVQEIVKIMKKDLASSGGKVAAKCASYFKKLDEIRQKFETIYQTVHQNHTQHPNKSGFGTCKDAHALAYALNYYFRNFEKFLCYLVYLEALLIQVDKKVAELGIGVNLGQIIKPGAKVPPKPTSIK